MTTRTLRPRALPLLLAALFAFGCSKGATNSTLPKSDLPEGYALKSEPVGAQPVGELLAAVQDGDAVVVLGRVGGSENPFVSGVAAFTIVDPSVLSCADDEMGCETPWDYCCTDPHELASHMATIEFHDGKEISHASPRGFHGLDHLSTVVVSGTAHRDARGNLTVVADGLFVRG